ncbi:MAG: murein biosynthesis integral membrane protein MurJ [Caldilinea sp.]|jgi:putative peptidoglycan lipid II flippase|nr:murein biosynthesis integral membrane protein MurJ [Caldilinea sp.]
MAGAALLVMLFFVLSRLSGLAREVVIGARFGTAADYDAYLAAFRIPDLLFQIAAGGALGSAFIPVFASTWQTNDRQAAWRLFSQVLNLVTLVLVALSLAAAFGAEPLVRTLLAPGFTQPQQQLTVSLLRLMLAGTVIFGVSGLVMGALNTTQHFLAPAAAPVLYNLAILAAAFWLAPHYGIYGLGVGVVAGSVTHLLVQLPVLLHKGFRPQWTLSLREAGVRRVTLLMGPRVLGLIFVQLHFWINTVLASGLGNGALSALNYAWLLMLLPQGILAQGIATVVFPTLAAQLAAGEGKAFQITFERALRVVVFLVAPSAMLLLVLRRPTISLLLERGAFDTQSMLLVAYALQFYIVGLLFHAILEIVVRGFYALQDTWTPVRVGILAMSGNIGLSFLLVGALSFGGLALANSLATLVETVALCWLLGRRLPTGLGWHTLLPALAKTLVAAAGMGLAAWGWGNWVYHTVYLGNLVAWNDDWLTVLVGIPLALSVYLGVHKLLQSEELALALGLLRRRQR